MTDEDYIYMCDLEDKFTKKPTLWELAQAFPECRYMVGARLYYLQKKGYNHWLMTFYKKFLKMTKPVKEGEELDVQKAKQSPIQELYDFGRMRETSKRIQTKCPFHDEKNGSFFIFKEQNKFHCFSCQEHGDSIDFIMKLNGFTFIEAVKEITKG